MSLINHQLADAEMIMRDLLDNPSPALSDRREIYVSFRNQRKDVNRRDFATHMIHSYPAKMFRRIPSVFLDTVKLQTPATILDPFCGSGTVLLEANLRGHNAVGIDTNPLARLISRVKTNPLDPNELHGKLSTLLPRAKRSRAAPKPDSTLDYWLPHAARIGLHRLAVAISEIADENSQAFFSVALSCIVRRVSIADPAIPPLVRLRKERVEIAGTRYRLAFERSQSLTAASVYSAFHQAAKANIRRMSELYLSRGRLGSTHLPTDAGNAANTHLQSESCDAIITSPPYCGAQKYVRSMKLELILNGLSKDQIRQLDRGMLGTEAVTNRATPIGELLTGDSFVDHVVRRIYEVNPIRARMAAEYSSYLVAFAQECWRVLKPGGQLLVTLARNHLSGVPYAADVVFGRASRAVGFEMIATLVDPIQSRGLLTKRNKTAGRIDHEFIVWLRRPLTSQT